MEGKPPLFIDIETDGLLPTMTTIHCAVAIDPWGNTSRCTPDSVDEWVHLISQWDGPLVGHNIIAFDIPAIQKLYPWFRPRCLPIDTKVLAQLAVPDVLSMTMKVPKWKRSVPPNLWSAQSLKAWGYRLGELKADPPDFATYCPEMLTYCEQDVVVTEKLYYYLMENWVTSPLAVELEMQIGCILQRQKETGVCFNKEKAKVLVEKLTVELEDLMAQLQEIFPPWQRLKKRAVAKVNNKTLGRIKGEVYEVWETVEFNPCSSAHIVSRLEEVHGWQPSVFTDKGNPKMDDEVMADLERAFPEMNLVRKYQTAKKIMSYLSSGAQSWLNHLKDGRIHGDVQGCGAGTRRMTHNSPNLGQVPSARAYLGGECRELFSPPPGFAMVGIDADQLELRTLAHFLYPYDQGVYSRAAIHGDKAAGTDIHSLNARAIGVDRDSGKTIFYAYIYGSGVENLGKCVTKSWDSKKNIRVGSGIKRRLEANLPALVQLKADILKVHKDRGYLKDLDGQMFRLRSDHSSLNELNQRAGAIIMKRWQAYLYQRMDEENLKWLPLLTVHDEVQLGVKPEDVPRVEQLVAEAFTYVTEYYKLACPIGGKAIVGSNWKETH